jgi:hypothetical protein
MTLHAIDNRKEPVAATRSPERQALAVAIAAAVKAARSAEDGRAAVARARELVDAAETKLAAASAAVTAAKARHAKQTAAAIGRGAPVPATSALKAARALEQEAEDDFDAGKAALEQLQTALADSEGEIDHANIAVEAAVNSVLAAEAAIPLVERLEQIKAEIPALQAAANFVRRRGFEHRGTYSVQVPALHAPLAEIVPRITNAVEHGLPFHPMAAAQHPSAAVWEAACAALRDDPDADLP